MALRLWMGLGLDPSGALGCLTPVLTYSAHAVMWALAMALWVRREGLASSTRHVFWRAAMVGPLVTTSLAAIVPVVVGHAFAGASN